MFAQKALNSARGVVSGAAHLPFRASRFVVRGMPAAVGSTVERVVGSAVSRMPGVGSTDDPARRPAPPARSGPGPTKIQGDPVAPATSTSGRRDGVDPTDDGEPSTGADTATDTDTGEDEDEVTTPVGTAGADVAHNPDTGDTDLQQPGTEPLMDPSTTKSVAKESETLRRAADPHKE